MKPVDQTIFGSPNGNCYQACLASIFELDLEEVPNFITFPESIWYKKLTDWCDEKFGLIPQPIDSIGPFTNCICLASGKSPRGDFKHAIVWDCDKMEMIHDPHPSRDGIVGEPTHYTVFVVVDPSRLRYNPIRNVEEGDECRWYSPGNPSSLGSCEGDGHHLCNECEERVREDPILAAREQALQQLERSGGKDIAAQVRKVCDEPL